MFLSLITLRPGGVEAVDPIAQRLPVHAADLGCRTAVHPIPNRRQRQQPTALVRALDDCGPRFSEHLDPLDRAVLMHCYIVPQTIGKQKQCPWWHDFRERA